MVFTCWQSRGLTGGEGLDESYSYAWSQSAEEPGSCEPGAEAGCRDPGELHGHVWDHAAEQRGSFHCPSTEHSALLCLSFPIHKSHAVLVNHHTKVA